MIASLVEDKTMPAVRARRPWLRGHSIPLRVLDRWKQRDLAVVLHDSLPFMSLMVLSYVILTTGVSFGLPNSEATG